ncbi:T9SS type A sorting domain-containing protein [bacterium]|nr:T9SS type A sorting domain-containing protein [bacterium]
MTSNVLYSASSSGYNLEYSTVDASSIPMNGNTSIILQSVGGRSVESSSSDSKKIFHGFHMSSDTYDVSGMDFPYDRKTVPLLTQENGLSTTKVEFNIVIDGVSTVVQEDGEFSSNWSFDWNSIPNIPVDAEVEVWTRAFNGLTWSPYFKSAEFIVDNEYPVFTNVKLFASGNDFNSTSGELNTTWEISDNLDTSIVQSLTYKSRDLTDYLDVNGETGVVLWLDASDKSWFNLSSDKVVVWMDKSKEGADIYQSDSAKRPEYSDNVFNNMSGVKFNANSELLSSAINLGISNDMTLFIVKKDRSGQTSSSPSYITYKIKDSSSNEAIRIFRTESSGGDKDGFSMKFSGNSGEDLIEASGLQNNEISINRYQRTSTSMTYYRDGVLAGSDTGTVGPLATGSEMTLSIGDLSLVGDIGEIILFDRLLTSQEISQVESYLTDKWINGLFESETLETGFSEQVRTSWSLSNVNDSSGFIVNMSAIDDAGNETFVTTNIDFTPDRTAPEIDINLVEIQGTEDIDWDFSLSGFELDDFSHGNNLTWNASVYLTIEDAYKSSEEILQTLGVSPEDLISFGVSQNTNTEVFDGNIFGKEYAAIKISLSDQQGNSVTKDLEIIVNAVNDKPVIITDIGVDIQTDQFDDIVYNFFTNEDTDAPTVNLDDFVVDIDNLKSDLQWTVSGNNMFQVGSFPFSSDLDYKFQNNFVYTEIGNDASGHQLAFVPSENWYGDTDIQISVTDAQPIPTFAAQEVVMRVWPVNDVPSISSLIASVARSDEDTPIVIDLHDFESDVIYEDVVPTYHSQLNWTVEGSDSDFISLILGENDETDIISFVPSGNVYGTTNIVLRLTDTDSIYPSLIFPEYVPEPKSVTVGLTLVWNPINDAPEIDGTIEPQEATENGVAWTVDLSSFEKDVEDSDSGLTWQVASDKDDLVDISMDNATNIVTITPVTHSWGTANFTFTLSDEDSISTIGFEPYTPDPLSVSQNVEFKLYSVNDIPTINEMTLLGAESARTDQVMAKDTLTLTSIGYTDIGYANDSREAGTIGDEYVVSSAPIVNFVENTKMYSYLWYKNPVPTITGNVLWLDASDYSTITTTNFGVSKWTDKSVNEIELDQATTSLQPELLNKGIQSKPAIRFDNSSVLEATNLDLSILSNFTILIVKKDFDGQGGNDPSYMKYTIPLNDAAVDMYRENVGSGDSNRLNVAVSGGGSNSLESTTSISSGDISITTYVRKNGNLNLYVDGSSDGGTAGNSGDVDSDSSMTLSIGDQNLKADISELLVFDRALSSEDVDTLEDYLNVKWRLNKSEITEESLIKEEILTDSLSTLVLDSVEYEGFTIGATNWAHDGVATGNNFSKEIYVNIRPEIVVPESPDFDSWFDTKNITITWNSVIDLSGDDVGYRLKVWQVDQWDSPPPSAEIDDAVYYDTSWQEGEFLKIDENQTIFEEGTYYWTVFSGNKFSPTAWDYRTPDWMRLFHVDTTNPESPPTINVKEIGENGSVVEDAGKIRVIFGDKPEYHSVWLESFNDQEINSQIVSTYNYFEIVSPNEQTKWVYTILYPPGTTTYNVYLRDRALNESILYHTFIIAEDTTPPATPEIEYPFTLVNGILEAVTSQNILFVTGNKDTLEQSAINFKGWDTSLSLETDARLASFSDNDTFSTIFYPRKPSGNVYSVDLSGNESGQITVNINFILSDPTTNIQSVSRAIINSEDNEQLVSIGLSQSEIDEISTVDLEWMAQRDITNYIIETDQGVIASGNAVSEGQVVTNIIRGSESKLVQGENTITVKTWDISGRSGEDSATITKLSGPPTVNIIQAGIVTKKVDNKYIVRITGQNLDNTTVYINDSTANITIYDESWQYVNTDFPLSTTSIIMKLKDVVYNESQKTLWDSNWYEDNQDKDNITISGFDGLIYAYSELPENIVKLFHQEITSVRKAKGLSISSQRVLEFVTDSSELTISHSLRKAYQVYAKTIDNVVVSELDLANHDIWIGLPIPEDSKLEISKLVPVIFDAETNTWTNPDVPYEFNAKDFVIKSKINSTGIWGLAELKPFADNLESLRVYPNPWVPFDGNDKTGGIDTGVVFDELPEQSTIQIYTTSGKLVKKLVATTSSWIWDGKDESGTEMASGIYFYAISYDGKYVKGKITVIK